MNAYHIAEYIQYAEMLAKLNKLFYSLPGTARSGDEGFLLEQAMNALTALRDRLPLDEDTLRRLDQLLG